MFHKLLTCDMLPANSAARIEACMDEVSEFRYHEIVAAKDYRMQSRHTVV